ncbi:MAG TPA: NAD(P)/FAD-dependent oxidoreductase [Candidatus Binatia bacterium]|nr:NAD(P)/FAD-dependent oxidoreductase [Candidatus Binatia bacterium]
MARTTKILILGGGFGGLYTALELEKALGDEPGIEITLVNRENFFLFTPMLHEVAASDLDITTIVNPIRKLLRRTNFFDGEVKSIDLANKKVTVSHGIDTSHPHHLEYDHLVLALGSVTNFYNIPGLEERALTMKSLADAVYLRNRLIEHLEEADFECCPALRAPLLTFVVAGGGFAGVETVAAINDFLREALEFYPHLHEEMLRIILIEFAPAILPELGAELGEYARAKLKDRKVEFLFNTKVMGLSDHEVKLSNGETISTKTLIWTAGTASNPLLDPLPCRKDRGRLAVNEFLEVPGWPGLWALGDCASVPDKKTGRPYPPTAQHALRQGKVLGQNIAAAMKGRAKKPFVFSTLGQLAAIGRRTGVAKILGFKFSGLIAWWLWRTIYLSKLPRIEKKLRVTLDWTLDLVFSKDLVQFMPLRPDRRAPQSEEVYPPRVTAQPSGIDTFSPRQEAM